MKKTISLVLALFILFSGQAAQAAVKKPVLTTLFPIAGSESKLTEEVQDQKGKAGKQEYLIQFKSSQDLTKLPINNYTAQGFDKRQAKGKAVVASLQAAAATAQKPFINRFKQTKTEYKSFYIANMLWVKTDFAQIEELAKDPSVKKVYINKVIKLAPEKPVIETQAIPNTIEPNILQVKADQVWAQGFYGTGVVVGIIDSGVDWTHPALQSKFRAYDPANPGTPDPTKLSYSWFDGVGSSAVPMDDNGHGTHVTGTILGQTTDFGIGVAPGATWIAAKVMDSSGSGSNLTVLEAGQWMLAPNGDSTKAPAIINNSWGGGDNVDEWYRDIVKAWRAAGILPIFAAGNQTIAEPLPWPGSINNPAHYPESVAVAALNNNNSLASFSKLGPSPYDREIPKPELSAPGVSIRSAVPGNPAGAYTYYSGTSMAAPHIAGVAALILSANNTLSTDEVLFALEQSATPLVNSAYPTSPNMAFGYGLVNAKAAVDLVLAGLKKTTLKGQVIDQATGLPVAGAKVRLLENPLMLPIETDEMGNYQMNNLLSGKITIQVYHPKYGNSRQKLSLLPNTMNTADITVKYLGVMQSELGYDDGTGENAIAYEFSASDNGFGVAFKPDRYGLIKNIKAFFWDYSFPEPPNTATTMDLAIFEADQNMVPTETLLLAPVRVQVKRGAWTTIDVSQYGISTDQPFVAVFLQSYDYAFSPAMALDWDSSIGNNNSYFYSVNYGFSPIEYEGYVGAWMVRANMEYAMESPTITGVSPTTSVGGVIYTTTDTVNVAGLAAGSKKIGILVNNSLMTQVVPTGNTFSGNVALTEGVNRLKAASIVNGSIVLRSAELTVTKDTISPVITVTAPVGTTVESNLLTVTGNVEDLNLAAFTINGQTVTPDSSGNFSKQLTIAPGNNIILLKATDVVGHVTETTLQITGVFEAEAAILKSYPETNQVIYAGTDLTLRVESTLPGASAGVRIDPVTTVPVAMTEISPGIYEAIWRVPANFDLKGVKAVYEINKGTTQLTATAPGFMTVRQAGISRVYGIDRYSTAADVSLNTFTKTDTVIITSGLDFPDALVGGVYGSTINAPILFTRPNDLPAETLAEIIRLGATKVKILGGTGAVSTKVETQLQTMGYQIQRLWGSDRYETAVQVALETNLTPAVIYLATGEDYADAMSIIPIAAKEKGILLLASKRGLDPATKAALVNYHAQNVIILGGTGAVTSAVEAELNGMGITTQRISGIDRYSTNVEIYKRYLGTAVQGAITASGIAFPDALSSGVMASRFNQPLILVNPYPLMPVTTDYLDSLGLKEITVLGYTGAVSEKVYQQLALLIN